MSGPVTGVSTTRMVGPETRDELIRSGVRLARLTFGAAASSVFLYDPATDQLVFEASSGEGADLLMGVAVPADRGLVGWVWQTGETVIAHDVASDPRFDRGFAETTGYVPQAIVAAPLHAGSVSGVIEVLDPEFDRLSEGDAMDILAELANHLSAALMVLTIATELTASADSGEPWQRLEAALASRGQDTVHNFVSALDALLTTRSPRPVEG